MVVLGDGRLGQLVARVMMLHTRKLLLVGRHGEKLQAAEKRGIQTCKADGFVARRRADVVVDGKVALELKAVEHLLAVHEAQLLTYLRLGSYKVGLLLNFNVPVLKDGLKRMVL